MSETAPWSGGRVGERAHAVMCDNPGPMTLTGTNTWVLLSPETHEAVVVDPGPRDEKHLQDVLHLVAAHDSRVVLTLTTHHHDDHIGSLGRWRQLTGAPVRGAGGDAGFADGELIQVGSLATRAILTPGHTADSVSFLVPDERLLLTGDTVLGQGTSIVAHPDGNLADYLASLATLQRVADAEQAILAPAHGPAGARASEVIRQYREHRQLRLEQVRAALAAGAEHAEDPAQAVVERVYADVPRSVWPAAKATVQAQLAYLAGGQ